jgi:membrane protease YdiL (CAAX protease family)
MVSEWVLGREPEQIAHDTLKALVENPGAPAAWMLGGSAVVLAPLSEELVFRVFLQSMLLRLLGSAWGAIFLASAVFAAVHMGQGVPRESAHALAPLFVLSVGMGVSYERSRSLWAPVVMHMGFNAANVALAVVMAGLP